jgi:hypothetical protein
MKRENYTKMFQKWSICMLISLLMIGTIDLSAQCLSPSCTATNYGLSETCQDTITAEHLVTNYDPSCTYVVVIMRNGFPSPPIVTGADIGKTFPYMVNVVGGGGCSGNILIEDKRAPVVICPTGPIEVPCGYDVDSLPRPEGISDCSPPLNIVGPFLIPQSQNNACNNPLLRVYTVRWLTYDTYNNADTCEYELRVMQADPLDVEAPDDVTLQCSNGMNISTGALGVPTIDGVPFTQGGGFCNLMLSDPEDKVISICGNARVISRTWQIMNMCTLQAPPIMITQTITIQDLQSPTIVLPVSLITVNAISNQCVSGIVNLPAGTITESCSPMGVSVFVNTPVGVLNSNGGSIAGLPVGNHIITYIVSDPCGNTSSATLTLVVADNTPPNAICRTFTTIPLNNLGHATAPAHVFNNGSYDNCGPVYFKVARMSGNSCDPNPQFNDQVHFCCADIPDNNIMIILRVYDVNPGTGQVSANAFAGRYNSCMIEVEVQDKLPPTVTCPLDITVDCLTDLNYYLTNEIPASVDNCGENLTASVVLDSSQFVVACKTGYVTRIITYTDGVNVVICQQRITLENISMPGGVNIVWPNHFMGQSCGGSVHPDSLPAGFGRPVVTASLCGANIGIGYEDLVFQIVEDACFKVVRTWSVMNWCTYDPNTSEGLWKFYQIIKVLDDEDPVITPLANVMEFVEILGNNCDQATAFIDLDDIQATDCTPESDLRYRYRIDFNSNGTYETGFILGKNASRVFPIGVHTIQYIVDDLCGNTAAFFQTVTLQIDDRKKPTPVLKDLHTALMPASNPPMVMINAALFNSGSYDNCTPDHLLKFSYSTDPNDNVRTFFCEDAPLDTVQIYVHDQAGNYDFLYMLLHIKDEGLCPDSLVQGGMIYGKIVNEFDEEIESVKMELENSNKAPVVTGIDGSYMFDRVSRNNFYRLKPGKNTDPRNGLSTIDILLIQRHILSIEELNSPYKLLAADVNRSGVITASDLVEIQRMILGKSTSFGQHDSWMFVDQNYVFPDSKDPFSYPIPQIVELNQIPGTISRNFVGIKMGDVNNTASMNSFGTSQSRGTGTALDIHIQDKQFGSGEYLYVPFYAGSFTDVHGFQSTLEYNTEGLQFIGIEKGRLQNFNEQNVHLLDSDRGWITFNWFNAQPLSVEAGEPLFFTKWQTKSAGQLSDAIAFNSAWLENEAYHKNETNGYLNLIFEGKTKNQFTNKLMQNKPNPFSQETIIGFELAEKGQATITLMDLSGKVIWQNKGEFSKGMNEVRIHKNQLASDGIYLYRLDTQDFTDTKRMILMNN